MSPSSTDLVSCPTPRARVSRLGLLLAVACLARVAPAQTGGTADEPPPFRVVGVVGEPQLIEGEAFRALQVDDAFGLDSTIRTGFDMKAAIAIGGTNGDPDLLLVGPNSVVVLRAADELEREIGGTDILAEFERGAYRAIVRSEDGTPRMMLRTGDRVLALDGADFVGTYAAARGNSTHLVLAGEIVIHLGSRKIRVKEGMARPIIDGRVRGARKITSGERSISTGLTQIPGLDVSQPASIAAREPDLEITPGKTPPDWFYDASRNKHWNPEHGHWHHGKPPPGKVATKVPPPPAPETTPTTTAPSEDVTPDSVYVRMSTSEGDFTLELDRARAPITVKNFLGYVDRDFYDGMIFHRVMINFMIQGGGFDEDFTRKQTADPIVNEWRNGLKNESGTIAMARLGGQPDSATSQFFINVKNNTPLDMPRDGAAYAVFGCVVAGQDVIELIRRMPVQQSRLNPRETSEPIEPIVIRSVERVAAPETAP